jgi:hypothetical protein
MGIRRVCRNGAVRPYFRVRTPNPPWRATPPMLAAVTAPTRYDQTERLGVVVDILIAR